MLQFEAPKSMLSANQQSARMATEMDIADLQIDAE